MSSHFQAGEEKVKIAKKLSLHNYQIEAVKWLKHAEKNGSKIFIHFSRVLKIKLLLCFFFLPHHLVELHPIVIKRHNLPIQSNH